jgi:hypothetical protein
MTITELSMESYQFDLASDELQILEQEIILRASREEVITKKVLLQSFMEDRIEELASKQAIRRAARLEEGYSKLNSVNKDSVKQLIPNIEVT